MKKSEQRLESQLDQIHGKTFLESYEGEFNDLPNCPKGCGKMLPEDNGGFQYWNECPQCGECDE